MFDVWEFFRMCTMAHAECSVVYYVLFETLEGAHMLSSNRLDFETTSSKCYVMGMNKHLLRSANFLAVFFHIFHFDIFDMKQIKIRTQST